MNSHLPTNQKQADQKAWNQIKLRTQMLLGYTIPVVFFAGSTFVVYVNANKIFATFVEVENAQKSIIESDTMVLAGTNMVANMRGYFFNQNPQFLDLYQQSRRTFVKASQNLRPVLKDPEQIKRFHELEEIVQGYDEYANKQVFLLQNKKFAESKELFVSGIGRESLLRFFALNELFNKTEIERLTKENQQARNSLENAIKLLVIGAILSMITGIFIAWMIARLVTQKITRSIGEIVNSSEEMGLVVQQQEKITSNQVVAVEQTTTTIEELEVAARQASEQAASSSLGASQVLNLSANGNGLVQKTLTEMEQMKGKVQAIAEQITYLSEQTNQIGNISQLVSDLANQTNMLALNAAVEAVRAGEYGRGFSVVASEIRKLADESQKSAHKINTLVKEVQQATVATVAATETGIKSVDNTVILAQQTARAFTDVGEEINNIVLNSQQISVSSKQQAVGIQQVAVAANIINQNAQESSVGMTQIKTGISKLNNAAVDLRAIVE